MAMSNSDKEGELYDSYLDALAEHTKAAGELRAAELRHLHDDDESASYIAERASLLRAKQDASRRYLEMREANQKFKRAIGGSNQ